METNRARTTLDMKTPQALGRCDSNTRPVPRQSEESRSFCGTCPPKSVRSWRLLFGCLTVFDLNEGTGRMAPGNRGIHRRILPAILPAGGNGRWGLLNSLRLRIRADQVIEDGEDVPGVVHHARKYFWKLRIAFGLSVPFGENHGGDFDISPQFVRGMAAQKQAVKKGGFTLREVEVMHDFGRNELWHRGHREKCSLPKSRAASSRTGVFLPRSG